MSKWRRPRIWLQHQTQRFGCRPIWILRFGVLGTVGANTLPLLLQYLPILFDQARLQAELQKYGFWSALIFVLLHMVATMIGIPGVILTIVGGVLFGLVWGSLWSLIGATLGAIGAFWVARSFLHDWIQCRLGHHQSILTFNEAVERHALTFVLVIRFAPISPFNLANFLFGLTTIHWFPYSLGTFLGIIPGVITYTWVGVTSNQAIHGHNPMPLLMACSLLAILSALPLVLHRDRNRYS